MLTAHSAPDSAKSLEYLHMLRQHLVTRNDAVQCDFMAPNETLWYNYVTNIGRHGKK